MSIVIIGGNECMEGRYRQLCEEYNCRAKVFTKLQGGLRDKIGSPDILVLFTGTMSHKMLRSAMSEMKGSRAIVARSHTSSMSALRRILDDHAKQGEEHCA